ncbi:uncharacterized protein DS421_19g653170 [Arachis hypogaea]|uniref:STM1-like N-terminal domain-containing protein n=1 Tax=Arachis hypogaea TaxID=3818 RepID=A0A6B9V9L6_ARAHY|nr:uncharacterized protein DS421_19g653170 [Arachis hypogaea]
MATSNPFHLRGDDAEVSSRQIAAAAATSPLKKGSAAAAQQQQQTQLASKPVPPAQAGGEDLRLDIRGLQMIMDPGRRQIIDTYIDGVAAGLQLLGSAMLGKKRRVTRSVAVRWTTKAAVAAGHGGVASCSGIPATIATARDGSPGYHGFDDKKKTERVACSGALGQ